MALSVIQNSTAIARNLVAQFKGVGGTPPYSYAVLPDGPGGVIDPLTGFYTSPNFTGKEVIQVTDSAIVPAVVTTSILVCTVQQLVCEIIQKQMYLDDGRVFMFDQKIPQPKDEKIFVVVQTLLSKPFGNKSEFLTDDPGMVEVQTVNMYENLSIDIKSRGPDARDRKEEIIMALRSTYAKQQMAANSFYIAAISNSFLNLSELDGAAIPYRFNISVAVQYMVTKSRAVPFFDTFQAPAVTTEP